MAEGKFVSYLRVSTDKQGRSGLGIEAQRVAVEGYLNGGRWTVAAEYVETESGKRSDRPKLAAALAHAKAIKAKLVFAKLDRLTHNVDLLEVTFHGPRHTHASQLIDASVDIVTISKRLGHAKPSVTLAIYAHMFKESDVKAAAAINAALAKSGGNVRICSTGLILSH
jgi:integrase